MALLGANTFSFTALNITTFVKFSTMTFIVITLNIITLSIMTFNNTQHGI
jgi:hypothetical protein